LVQHKKSQKKQLADMAAALLDLEKIIKSKKANFVGGLHGLQAHRANAIACYL
jgi:hypothetical protein